MTNEIAQQDSPFGAVQPFGVPATLSVQKADPFTRLRDWAELYVQVGKAAGHLASTDFVPDGLRGKPEAVAAAMLKGAELGIDPLDALQNIHVVKGKVGFSAEFMRRRIIEAGHEIRFKESTDTRCVVEGRRRGEEAWERVTFTADNAKTAQIDIRSYPADKLVARASSRLCRRVFPDVLGGSLIIEDVLDGEVVEATPNVTTTPATGTGQKAVESAPVQRKTATRKAPAKKAAQKAEKVNDPSDQPPLPDEEPASDSSAKPEPEQVTEVGQNSQGAERITDPQLKKLHVVMQKEGLTERAAALEWLSQQINRPLDTSKDLSKDEASGIIDFLEQAQAADAAKGRGQ
ncbi:hypothetical protein [Gordonia sp. OPL2]|uniref:hypothetical protein n=1 Tax=Gordonia sp. OPL2 TaxID=2486274 RepID=UPI0016560478|nr:hypothetical protein [Gordonia sp. OPL2]ROZ88981.1 hypothetical protein EEB19_19925 [Gordonia sp. OPL2]